MRGSGGTPPGRLRPRGNIEELSSGSLRVRVYAGVDVLTGRRLYLKEVVPAGPDAAAQAEAVRRDLIELVSEGRQPRTNASLAQLLDKHLESSQVQQREKETRQSYITKHIVPVIGDRPVSAVTVELLEAFYAELRRCCDHCGLPTAVAESLRFAGPPGGA